MTRNEEGGCRPLFQGISNVLKEDERTGLKPCPFCGSEAKIDEKIVIGGRYRFMVYCTWCAIRTQYGDNYTDIVGIWNRRIKE